MAPKNSSMANLSNDSMIAFIQQACIICLEETQFTRKITHIVGSARWRNCEETFAHPNIPAGASFTYQHS